MDTVHLNNGSEEAKLCVDIVYDSLTELWDTNVIAFVELVRKVKNPSHTMFGNTSCIAKELNLMDDNDTIQNSIRNIVESSVTGKGLNMKMCNPY